MSYLFLLRGARRRLPLRVTFSSGLLSLLAVSAPIPAADLPPVIKTLQSQGMSVVGPLPAPRGMTGWAGRALNHLHSM